MIDSQLLASALAGLGLGLGLIVAIGAQNAFVLRQGIRREHVLPVVVVCIASDAVLIVAGVAGAGALFTAVPWLVDAARWGGALFLLGYAFLAARRALRRPDAGAQGLRADRADLVCSRDGGGPAGAPPGSPTLIAPPTSNPVRGVGLTVLERRDTVRTSPPPNPLMPAVATTLALTWLNPHVYLDTFVLLGSVGSSHGPGRWAFAVGAVLGSTLWFTALGVAARSLAPVFARPGAWRMLDGVIAVVMVGIAAGLGLGT